MRSTLGPSVTDEPDRPPGSGASRDLEFTTFYRAEHEAQVRRAFLLIGSSEAANDVVQDAMAAVYQRWHTIDAPGPYLNRAVLNGCRDVARKRNAEQTLVRRLRPTSSSTPEDTLLDVVARLPFNQRAAIVLRFYAGMTEREIATALDTSTGSIGPWIKRALTTMSREFK